LWRKAVLLFQSLFRNKNTGCTEDCLPALAAQPEFNFINTAIFQFSFNLSAGIGIFCFPGGNNSSRHL
jgi:hypothetical protein